MDIKKLIIDLYNKGIEFWIDKGELHYRAKNKIQDDDKDQIYQHKYEIIDTLQSNKKMLIQDCDCSKPYEEYNLTEIQSAYLLGRGKNFRYGGVSSHVYFEVKFPLLDQKRTTKIWDMLIERHDNLRLVINDNQQQKVIESVPSLKIVWQEEENKAHIQKIRNELSHKYYDITKWPLFDVAVSKNNGKSLMHLSFDFLIMDWTSIWILLKEFEMLYFEKEKLSNITYNFKHYYYERVSSQMSSKYIIDEFFWKNKIQKVYEAPQLPVLATEPLNEFFRLNQVISSKQWEKIKRQAAQYGITPTIVLLTTFAFCLDLYCENSNFVLNLTTMNRESKNHSVDTILGDFTTINLLNIDVKKQEAFIENAKAIQRELIENVEHNLFSGMEVLRELRKEKEGDNFFLPIVFTSAIGTNDNRFDYLEMGDYGISQTPQVFLDCQVIEINGNLQINWDIRKGVFPAHLMENAMIKYLEGLEQLMAMSDWSEPFCIDPLTKKEKNIRTIINATKYNYEIKPLHFDIIQQIHMCPDNIAVVKDDHETSYKELGEKISGIYEKLKCCKLKDNELVGIMMKHSDVEIAAIISILCLGGAYVPLDQEQPLERLNSILEQTELRYVLVDNESAKLNNANITIINCSKYSSKNDIECENICIDKRAYVIFTSGTTGIPKGVVISHKAASNTIKGVRETLRIPKRPVVLGLSKLNFDLSVFDIFGILSCGGTVVYPNDEERINPEHLLNLIRKYNINMWNTVPALLQMLVSYCLTNSFEIELLTDIWLSGDWIPVSLLKEIDNVIPSAEVVSLGGATEGGIWSIYHKCLESDKQQKSVPYGRPLPNQKFYVLNSELEDAPTWVSGELFIGGNSLADGYLKDVEKTKYSFIVHKKTGNTLYRTGDYGRYLPNGEIEFLGRKDNQVKLNGFRIELGEIEAALLKNTNVKEACVVTNTKKSDKQLIGFISPKQKERKSVQLFSEQGFKMNQTNVWNDIPINRDKIKNVIIQRDTLSIKAMLECLQQFDLLFNDKKTNFNQEMVDSVMKSDKSWILKYWLMYMLRENYLIKKEDGSYNYTPKAIDVLNCPYTWEEVKQQWKQFVGDANFINYIEESSQQLIKTLNGEKNPVDILYPEGNFKYVEAIYNNNIFSDYYNSYIVKVISEIVVSQAKKRIRILELGAGTGFTSKRVLEMLNKNKIEYDYYFTDVSNSFLARGKTYLSSYPNVKYQYCDMNSSFENYGFLQNEFDIVLAVGVLENAKDIRATLNYIRQMISINGWLVFTEPIIEEPWILVSQILMMEKPADNIRSTKSYLSKTEWLHILEMEPGKTYVYPNNNCIEAGNIKVFVKQFNYRYENIEIRKIGEEITKYLPAYMIPHQYYILNQLPLNQNGKIDRKKLQNFCDIIWERNQGKKATNNIIEYENGLTKELCEIVATVLGRDGVEPNENLYKYGVDSLLLAQSAGKIRDYIKSTFKTERISFDMILRRLLNVPIIKELSEYLHMEVERNDSIAEQKLTKNSIGKLTVYGGGKGPLRVVFHAGFGTMNSMRFVIEHLVAQNKGPVVSITINDMEGYTHIPAECLVKTISSEYTQLIIREKPQSVQLIGYCLGGLIAIETAHYLIEAGIEIKDIALIDSYPSTYDIMDSLVSEIIFLPNYFLSYGKIFKNTQIDEELFNIISELIRKNDKGLEKNSLLNYVTSDVGVSKRLKEVITKLSSMDESERFEIYANSIPDKNDSTKSLLLSTYHTNKASWRGAKMQPYPYLGKVRYLLAKEKMKFLFANVEQTLDFWRDVCFGDFNVIEVEGNHVTCAEQKENAELLADILGDF